MVSVREIAARNYLAAQAVVLAVQGMPKNRRYSSGSRKKQRGRRAIILRRKSCTRTRRSVEDIYKCLGPVYFRRSYRMLYESFLILHEKLSSGIADAAAKAAAKAVVDDPQQVMRERKKGNYCSKNSPNYKPPPVPNGIISTSVRLACAIRYFAGGSPYDLMGKYGISHTEVLASIWYVVEATNTLPEFLFSIQQTRRHNVGFLLVFEKLAPSISTTALVPLTASSFGFKNLAAPMPRDRALG